MEEGEEGEEEGELNSRVHYDHLSQDTEPRLFIYVVLRTVEVRVTRPQLPCSEYGSVLSRGVYYSSKS